MGINKLLNGYIVVLFVMAGIFLAANSYAASCTCPNGTVHDVAGGKEECRSYCNTIIAGVNEGCKTRGDCSLNDFSLLAVQISYLILGLTGSLALIAFVYGGVMFLISAGNRERVEKGKRVITGAVIGIVIVFTSYIIVSFVSQGLGIDPATKNIFSTGWFK